MNEVCKLDCTSADSDNEIGQQIWNMTIRNYHLIKHDYTHINGLIMLSEGNLNRRIKV